MFSLGLAASFVCKAWTKKTLIQKSIRRSMCTCTEYPSQSPCPIKKWSRLHEWHKFLIVLCARNIINCEAMLFSCHKFSGWKW